MRKQEESEMNVTMRRMIPLCLLTLAVLVASANAYGATVDISATLLNPGFELANVGLCPMNWNCSGSPGAAPSYTVTAAQYIAGSDGLTGSKIVPGGMKAATCPYPVEGSCFLYQTGTAGNYVAGNTYQITMWFGTPLKLPWDNSTPAGAVQTLRFYWLGTGGAGIGSQQDVPAPIPGSWTSMTFQFTPTGNQVGQPIGVGIFISSGGNNLVVDMDIAAACSCP